MLPVYYLKILQRTAGWTPLVW